MNYVKETLHSQSDTYKVGCIPKATGAIYSQYITDILPIYWAHLQIEIESEANLLRELGNEKRLSNTHYYKGCN